MLLKKTLKVASATTLWMVALFGATSAMAEISFDATATAPNTPVTFSKENLSATPTGVTGYYTVSAGNGFKTTGTIGAAGILTGDGAIWIRYDAGGSLMLHAGKGAPELKTPLLGAAANIKAYNATSFETDGYLVYRLNPADKDKDVPVASTTTLTLDFKDIVATSGQGDGTVQVRAFSRGTDAIAGGGSGDGLNKSATLLKVANTLSVAVMEKTQTATVSSGFTQFALGKRVPLGGFQIELATDHFNADGTPVDIKNLANVNVDVAKSSSMFSGAGGFGFAKAAGGWTLEQLDETTGVCNGTAGGKDGGVAVGFGAKDVDYPAGPAAGPVALLPWYLCATVAGDNAEEIAEGTYDVAVTLAATDATRSFSPVSIPAMTMGTVKHDGTTVNIPFLSSYEGYVQRLLIVNRNKADVGYKLVFQTEGVGTADPPTVEGMAAGDQTTVLKVADEVTFTSPTRASGTLTIVSTASMIDVATTMVNTLDQSTDTVILHRGLHDD